MSEFSGSAPNPTRGNMKNDQIFCNAVAIGCSNPNDNTNNESRFVIKRQDTDNNNKSLIEALDNDGVTYLSLDKDFNMAWTNEASYDSNSTYKINFTHEEINVFGGGTIFNPGIQPNVNLTGHLGTSAKKWYTAYFNNAYATSFNTISDQRIKTNIVDANNSDCMNNIRSLSLKKYNYEDGSEHETENGDATVSGLIAQEVKTVLPHAVKVDKGLLPDGTVVNDFHYLKRNFIHMEMLGAIKYLDNLVQTQATTISNLESRIAALESGN